MIAANDAVQRHPFIELLARYRAIFQAAWAARAELTGPKRLADEAAFLPAALSLQETPAHPAPRRTALAICALFLIALMWSIFGHIDIVAVAQGRVVVSQRSKQIQPLEASLVKAIHVKDGDHVHQGQLLIELDGTAPQADHNRVRQEHAAAQGEVQRTQALLDALSHGRLPNVTHTAQAEHAQLQSEWFDITAQLANLEAQARQRQAEWATAAQTVHKLQTTLPLVRQREQDIQGLSDQGFMAGHASQDRARDRIELEQDLATAQARQTEIQAAVEQAQRAHAAYRAEIQRTLRERLTQASLKTAQLHEETIKTTQRTQLAKLTAPVAGTVQQLAVHTTGGVVTPAQVLLVLVPADAEVTADVVLENKDVGFVTEGQTAEIKLETFPFTRYGTVPAQVIAMTADAVLDEKRGAIFPVTLKLDRAALSVDGKMIRLAPGMNITAEIKTGRRQVIDYLLSPVREAAEGSLKER